MKHYSKKFDHQFNNVDIDMDLSIITPVFNNIHGMRKTLDSVIENTYGFIGVEYVIEDALSTDGTVELIKEYMSKYPGLISLYSEKDNGITDGVRRAIDRCKGDYCLVIPSGDVFRYGAIEKYLEYIGRADIIYGKILHKKQNCVLGKKTDKMDAITYMIPVPSLCLKKDIYSKHPFIGEFYSADYFFEIELLGDDSLERAYIDDILIDFEGGGISETELEYHLAEEFASHVLKNLGKECYDFFKLYGRECRLYLQNEPNVDLIVYKINQPYKIQQISEMINEKDRESIKVQFVSEKNLDMWKIDGNTRIITSREYVLDAVRFGAKYERIMVFERSAFSKRLYDFMSDVKGKKFVVFGSGELATDFFDTFFVEGDISIVGVVDNSEIKQNKLFYGFKIMNPILFDYSVVDYVIVANYWFNEVYNQLLHLGVDSDKIVFVV